MTVEQLPGYKGILFEKGGTYMSFVYNSNSRKIMIGSSRTHPFSMFIHKDIDDTIERLMSSDWNIVERYDKVEL